MATITKFVLYLSGPMTGFPEHNYPAFRLAARQLREAGYIVVSPHELEPTHTATPDWHDYMRADLEAFAKYRCNAVATLDGWYHSRGAKAEVGLAMALDYPIQPVDTWLRQWAKHSDDSVQPALI
jgi:nucleoside 2-deoxyribosyltransferase